MDNLDLIRNALEKAYTAGVHADIDKEEKNGYVIITEAKNLLNKLTFSFQIVSKADKVVDMEQIGSNIIQVKMKEFVK